MIAGALAIYLALQQAEPAVAPPAPQPAPSQEVPRQEVPKQEPPASPPPPPTKPSDSPAPTEAKPESKPAQDAPATPEGGKQGDATQEATPSPIAKEGIPNEAVLPEEKPTRAYIEIDRVSVAAGMIESDDDAVIVLRDEKGRVKSFAKNRVLSVCYLLDGPSGRRVRVYFNDGRVVIANLVDDGYEHLEVEIAGIKTKYPRQGITAVRPYPTDRELYERFRTTLEPDQYSARYTLALWLYNKKMYLESKTELESLLEATNHYEAKRLLAEVTAQIALMEGATPPPDSVREGGGKPEGRTSAPGPGGALSSPILSDAEVNLIKVYELDTANPPRLQVPQSLIKEMLERYKENELIPAKAAERQAFYTKEPIEIVKTMFALKARELYGEIKVVGEPDQLQLFRQRVHNSWLIANCATSRCHGGSDGGRFFLHNRDWRDDNVRYTNLLILLRSRFDTLPLVDAERPTDSLLFQYALPKTEARRPHPEVRGWTPALTKGKLALQEDFIDWIRSMRLPKGDYPVEFEPPGLKLRQQPVQGGPDR
jgi:hypothetical protein